MCYKAIKNLRLPNWDKKIIVANGQTKYSSAFLVCKYKNKNKKEVQDQPEDGLKPVLVPLLLHQVIPKDNGSLAIVPLQLCAIYGEAVSHNYGGCFHQQNSQWEELLYPLTKVQLPVK